LIPIKALFPDASKISSVGFIPINVNKAVSFLVAIEPAQQIGKRPAAIANEIDAIIDSLSALREV
jgi:hypothetical protein